MRRLVGKVGWATGFAPALARFTTWGTDIMLRPPIKMEPPVGSAPTTCCLRSNRSTD